MYNAYGVFNIGNLVTKLYCVFNMDNVVTSIYEVWCIQYGQLQVK